MRPAAGMPLASVPAHGAEGVDAAVVLAHLKVERQTAGLEGFVLFRCRSAILHFSGGWDAAEIECVWHIDSWNSR